MKFCEKCGNELMDEAVVCPKCGCSVGGTNSAKTAVVEQKSKKAKTAKILGILSLLVLSPLAIPSIIMAVLSKKETGGVMNKDAKAAIVCSIIALVVWILMIVLTFGL